MYIYISKTLTSSSGKEKHKKDAKIEKDTCPHSGTKKRGKKKTCPLEEKARTVIKEKQRVP